MDGTQNTTSCDAVTTVRLLLSLFPLYASKDIYPPNDLLPISECNAYSKIVGDAPCFDFIVVGAGSAGCVVANRMTEVDQWNVLLLEAGIEEPPFTSIPAATPFMYNQYYDWGYKAMKDPRICRSYPENRCYVPRGKMMGGSSSVNYMHYLRGFKHDYDYWEKLGNEGWGYDGVLKYFRKSEDNGDDDVYEKYKKYHGRGGYLSVMRFPYKDPNTQALIDAWQEFGAKYVNLNADEYGVMHSQATNKNGERASSNRAFIEPIRKKRKNLTVSSESYVIKILTGKDSTGQITAYGVEYTRDNKSHIALARKEVILSAGVFNSPKLLMLSGIGPAEHLKKVKIAVQKDLPGVGQNMMDHVILGNLMATLNGTGVIKTCDEERDEAMQYQEERTGPMSSTGVVEVSFSFHSEHSYSTDEPPNLQSGMGPITVPPVKDGVVDPMESRIDMLSRYQGLGLGIVLAYPKSRGYVLLNETDPLWGQPVISLNYFNDTSDLQQLIAGAHIIANNIYRTKPMRKLGAKLIHAPSIPCHNHTFGSNVYWACIATEYSATNAHQCGTCKMGPTADEMAVVDTKLKVRGTTNLRVADASIMPRIVGGHLNAPAIMIGEKVSDLIKIDWKIPVESI